MSCIQYAVIEDHETVDEAKALKAVEEGKRVLVVGEVGLSVARLMRAATYAFDNCNVFEAVDSVSCIIDPRNGQVVTWMDETSYPFSDASEGVDIAKRWHQNEIDPI